MLVSIVTALFNRLDLTREFLASLERHPPPNPWEIIWVDDGSTDGTREWLATQPAPRHRILLNEKNLGYAAGNNRGARAAAGEILALLNNDLVLTPGWFEPMVGIFRRFPATGLVGNVQLNAATGAVDHSGVYYHARGKPTHDRVLPLTVPTVPTFGEGGRKTGDDLPASAPSAPHCRPVLAATAACMLVARTRFAALGGFDEMYRNGCEDVDLCLRARAAGWQNYVALDSVVRHHVSASPGRSIHNQRNTCRLMRRWRDEIPALAAESWREVALRDRWERKLPGWPWLLARLTRSWRRRPGQECPPWMRHAVARQVTGDLARCQRMFPRT